MSVHLAQKAVISMEITLHKPGGVHPYTLKLEPAELLFLVEQSVDLLAPLFPAEVTNLGPRIQAAINKLDTTPAAETPATHPNPRAQRALAITAALCEAIAASEAF